MVANVEMPSNGTAWTELRQGQTAQYLSPTSASVDICNLIERMMSPDPALRPTAEQLLEHWKLRQLMSQRPYPVCFPSSVKKKQSSVEALPQFVLDSPHSTPSSSPVYSFSTSPISSVPFNMGDESLDDDSFEDDSDFLMSRNIFSQEREQFRRQSLESYGVKTSLHIDNELFQNEAGIISAAAIAPRNLLDVFNHVGAEDDGMDDE